MGACCCCCGTSTSGQDIVFINGEPYMRVKPGSVAPAPRPATKRHVWRDIVFGVDRMDLKPHKQDLFDVVLKVDSLVSGETMVTIEPPKTGKRVPVDICCVLDVSGSMSAEATVKNATGATESHGLSVLDVAKHSVQTIIQMLGPNDRLSLVTYCSYASLIMSLRNMTAAGKKKAKIEVEHMRTEGSTNIWAGLEKGLQNLKGKHIKGKRRHQHILLLTDGQPNIGPPQGEVAALQRFQEENPEMKCVVHTFGFGYSLDTILLQNLAEMGRTV